MGSVRSNDYYADVSSGCSGDDESSGDDSPTLYCNRHVVALLHRVPTRRTAQHVAAVHDASSASRQPASITSAEAKAAPRTRKKAEQWEREDQEERNQQSEHQSGQQQSEHQPHQRKQAIPMMMPLEVLSRLLVDYFSSIQETQSPRSSENAREIQKTKSRPRERQSRIRDTPTTIAHNPNAEESYSSLTNSQDDTSDSDKKLKIDPNISALGSRAVLSSHCFALEDALALTSSPRLLLEAKEPHRVVHANAAFSQQIMGGLNARSPKNPNRTLQTAIHELFDNREDIPVTIYPVLGTERVSHYLVEAPKMNTTSTSNMAGEEVAVSGTKADERKRSPSPLELPSQTIG